MPAIFSIFARPRSGRSNRTSEKSGYSTVFSFGEIAHLHSLALAARASVRQVQVSSSYAHLAMTAGVKR